MKIGVNGNMLVIGTRAVDVELSKREQTEVAIYTVKQHFELSNSRDYYHYISADGEQLMLCQTQRYGPHEKEDRSVVRPATLLDKAALAVLKELEKVVP